MKKICFIAQFPPPMHGLSKAVDTLYNSVGRNEYEFEKVDITQNRNFMRNMWRVLNSECDLFYFTISQTKGGNIRDLIILTLLEIRKKKCLVHLHGGYYRTLVDKDMSKIQKKLNYHIFSKLQGAIVLSESLRWHFEGMIDSRKIYVVENCLDDEFLLDDEEIRNKQIAVSDPNRVKHILYLSNFIRSKGYPFVLELAKTEKERYINEGVRKYHFDFAGKFFEEEEHKFFESYVMEHELEDYVTYHGIVSGDAKARLLKDCDIFALPTYYPKEGQPISILEAMGNGMLIISTNHAGIPDVVVHGENGILLDSLDVKKAFEELEYLSPAEIAKKNYILAKNRFTEENYLNSMYKCFELTLQEE